MRSYWEKGGIIKLQNTSNKKLLNSLNRYDSRYNREKLSKIGLGKIVKIQNISKNELNQGEKLQKNQ